MRRNWLKRFFKKFWWKYSQHTLPTLNIESLRNFVHWLSTETKRVYKKRKIVGIANAMNPPPLPISVAVKLFPLHKMHYNLTIFHQFSNRRWNSLTQTIFLFQFFPEEKYFRQCHRSQFQCLCSHKRWHQSYFPKIHRTTKSQRRPFPRTPYSRITSFRKCFH